MILTSRSIGTLVTSLGLILLFALFFIKVEVDKESVKLCKELHSDTGEDFEPCPLHQGSNSWLLILAFFVIALFIAVGVYLLMSNRVFEHAKKITVNLKNLDKEQKIILDKLNEKEGSMYQSDLIKETGFSKVKITRVLDKLESRGVIEKKRRGMTNIVIVK